MNTNKAIVNKAGAITTSVVSSGLLQPYQAKKFLQQTFDATPLMQAIRHEVRTEKSGEIDKIGIGKRKLRGKMENVDDGYRAGVEFGSIKYETTAVRLPWEITEETIRQNIEGENLENVITNLMTKQVGVDSEDLLINGDENVSKDNPDYDFLKLNRSLTTAEACAWLAGATAGADYVSALTYAQVTNATSVVGEMNNEASITAIEAGQTFFSVDDEGNVILEYDINSRVHMDSETPQDIKKNRPLRVYDTFANDLLITFRPGKFDNDDDGWAVVEGLGRSMLQNYADDGALTNVNLDEDFLVDTGRSIGDSMYLNVGLQAVDSADKFYFSIITR